MRYGRDRLVLRAVHIRASPIERLVRPRGRRAGRVHGSGGLQAQLTYGDRIGRGGDVGVKDGFGVEGEEVAVRLESGGLG